MCYIFAFKEDEELFVQIANEKIKINEISPKDQSNFVRELNIAEGERYFKRDMNFNLIGIILE